MGDNSTDLAPQTIRRRTAASWRRAVSLATAAVLALSLAACSSDESNSKPKAESTKSAEPSPEATPAMETAEVAEFFDEASWAVHLSEFRPEGSTTNAGVDPEVWVRGDHVIVHLSLGKIDESGRQDFESGLNHIVVLDETGRKVWEKTYSDAMQVVALNSTVGVIHTSTEAGAGLDKDQQQSFATLLSIEDGSEVVTRQAPSPRITERGQVLLGDSTWLDESGETHPTGEILVSSATSGLVPELTLDPKEIPTVEDGWFEVRAVAPDLSVAVVEVTHSTPLERDYYAVNSQTGALISEVDCGDVDWAKHTDSASGVAYVSANREYAVLESFWITAEETKCFTESEGTKGVKFLAVSDDGTAYGEVHLLRASAKMESSRA